MRSCETYDRAASALRDMHLKHDASNELPGHVPNERRVYTQKIHDRSLYISVRHTDPVASLMERAIDAHANFLQKMHNSVDFLQNHPFSAMPSDLLVNKDDTVALERYAAHIKTRDKDGECVLSTKRAVHDAYRYVWSSYLLVVTHVLTCTTSKCREQLEGKRNFGMAFLLCAFTSAVGEYVLHSHRKYGDVDDTMLLTHLQRLNAELSNADHVYKQNVDKPTEKIDVGRCTPHCPKERINSA
ncbi:hypothetical protein CYMTET_16318 [Cymbomonas tetramitiformis]|uniref:Uncharacterized protein n=1 Tax=Cymbomonas tetramitiformis TaxID=36881 RepID=A0AAE0L8G2_9CHLO|nr:hypothetical protein CYMTET_16318 [Cymbomonas tetramitiformis]